MIDDDKRSLFQMWVLQYQYGTKVHWIVMDYGLAHTVAPTQDHGLVNGSAKSSDINRSVWDC